MGKILKCCFFIVAFITVFFYQYILGFIANVQKSLSIFHLSPVVQLIAEIFPICFGLYLVYIFTEWFLRFTGKFSIQEIYFGNNSGLKGTRENKESIFDKNLEEIIYFFEQTPYRYIFFEDLDRLPNLSILIHLRELNNLLNNDKSVNGPIKFIYAIRDDVFRGEDRTKFFDFIIPVIPFINSGNSCDAFLQKLADAEQQGEKFEITKEFVLDVSPYITDMRVLNNIGNEFLIYIKRLKTKQDINLKDEKLMALIIFKNLYPKEFAELQADSGTVKQAFEAKKDYIGKYIANLKKEIDSLVEAADRYTQDSLKSLKEIKK